eukprot:gene1694-463_t
MFRVLRNTRKQFLTVKPNPRFYSKIDKTVFYSKDHEWIRIDGDGYEIIGTVGVSDHAQDQLGDITYVGINKEIGDAVETDERIGDIESVKTVSEIFSPVSGEVVEINNLEQDSEFVNTDPFGKGWFMKVKVTDPNWKEKLMTPEDYEKFVQSE